jgi:ubiquinone/menaquinone biosynthesis C-methylase UbiE
VIYQHPLAYLLGLEGVALLRAWNGDFDEQFVRARLAEVRDLVTNDSLSGHPGVQVTGGATSDVYRQWAETYDDPGNELLELDLPVIDAILDTLPTGTAVDAACGTGRIARVLAERGHRVVGLDSSASMVHRARQNIPGLPFVVGDVTDLPLSDSSVDLVTNGLALTHVADLEQAMCEIARVLRPGGTAIVSDVHPDLVSLGSAVKGQDVPGGHQLAACYRRTVSDYLRAALRAGFRVRGFEERSATRDTSTTPRPLREIGPWREWPWTLLDWVPEASGVAWDIPAVLVWHLELG